MSPIILFSTVDLYTFYYKLNLMIYVYMLKNFCMGTIKLKDMHVFILLFFTKVNTIIKKNCIKNIKTKFLELLIHI